MVTEMTEAEKKPERQVELEDKIPARFYIRKVDLEKPGVQGGVAEEDQAEARADVQNSPLMADDLRVVRSTKRIEEYVARKAEEQDVKKRRVDFENSEKRFQDPFGDKCDGAENSGMDFDSEREREREGPP